MHVAEWQHSLSYSQRCFIIISPDAFLCLYNKNYLAYHWGVTFTKCYSPVVSCSSLVVPLCGLLHRHGDTPPSPLPPQLKRKGMPKSGKSEESCERQKTDVWLAKQLAWQTYNLSHIPAYNPHPPERSTNGYSHALEKHKQHPKLMLFTWSKTPQWSLPASAWSCSMQIHWHLCP